MTPRDSSQSTIARCTCKGDRDHEGKRIVTVGCPIHHLMPDGCRADRHEARCEGCGEFVCDHACAWYDDIDPDEPGEHGETFICRECGEFGVREGTLRLKPGESHQDRPDA